METPEITPASAKAPWWTAATNWTIAGGSLSSSVALESCLSPLDDVVEDGAKSHHPTPLILYPPAPDSSPCEITITFSQKHEVRQVYVRSTARVYEMYYANECPSSNEYLCTVRCGIAARDGQVLQATDVEEVVLVHQKCLRKGSDESGLRNSSNLTTSEDDWVEVKASDSSQPVNRNPCLLARSDAVAVRSSQDLFEATAEIADANPCLSFTLRLLSLRNKGCVCIDEIYLFADPVDVDNQVDPGENTSSNSLMAMLVPTVLQLAKTKVGGQDEYNLDTSKKQMSVDLGLKAISPIYSVTETLQEGTSSSMDQQEMKILDAAGSSVVPVQLGVSKQFPDIEGKHGKSSSHIEGVLDQLVSRVNGIEDLLLRFQENMLKPISSIDERLQRVEQQLEVLTKKTQNSGFTRICAPEFSCGESESNSFYNSGCIDSGYAACESNKDLATLSNPSDINPMLVNATEVHPSLVVCAPEFSNCDDEDENVVVEPVKECPEDKPKHGMLIDDALASALAGFLTSTSSQSQVYSHSVAVKSLEFPKEEECDGEISTSPRMDPDIHANPSPFSNEFDGTQRCSLSTTYPDSFVNCEEIVVKSAGDDNRQQTADEGSESQGSYNEVVASPSDIARADDIVDEMHDGEASNGILNDLASEKTGGLDEISESHTDDGTDTTLEKLVLNEPVASTEVVEGASNQDFLDNIIGFAHVASIPNYFGASILDVKFVSEENLNVQSSLEAVLSGTSDLNVKSPSDDETSNNHSEIGEESNLIPMDDWGSASNGLVSVDVDYYVVRDTPKNKEADELQDSCICIDSQETIAESLI